MFSFFLRQKYLIGQLSPSLLPRFHQFHYLSKQRAHYSKIFERTNSSLTANRKRAERKVKNKVKTAMVPSCIYLQVLGNGSNGAPRVVFLFTDQLRYLFNCGEGTQRLANEHKTKLCRLQAVFVTRSIWSTCGGLPGLSLTLRDVDVEELHVQGPPFLFTMIQKMHDFASVKTYHTLNVVDTLTNDRIYEDDTMFLQTIILNLPKEKIGNISTTSNETKISNYREEEFKTENESSLTKKSSYNVIETTVASYVCYLKPKPGVLNPDKCHELKVPPGPLLGKLKSGIDIILENGEVVRSKDVCSESDPWSKIIILDIPNEHFLTSMLSNETLYRKSSQYIQNIKRNIENQLENDDDATEIAVIVHFTPQHIIDHPEYQKFCRRIGTSSTKHIYVNGNENRSFSGFLSSQLTQYQLNQLNSRIFPILKESETIVALKEKQEKIDKLEDSANNMNGKENSGKELSGDDTNIVNDELNVIPVRTLTHYLLRGKKEANRSFEITLEPEKYINLCEELNDFIKQRDYLKTKYQELKEQTGIDYLNSELNDNCVNKAKYPIITFLGTGSCTPNKIRNVSSILIQTSDDCYILLDCGEGTFGQMVRLFGVDRTQEIIQQLKVVYISHKHADHHLGLFTILLERKRLLSEMCPNSSENVEENESKFEKILLLVPNQLQTWLDYYDNYVCSIKPLYKFISNGNLLDNALELQEKSDYDSDGIPSIKSVKTCLVKHSVHAFGVSFILDVENRIEPIKITYSGDTIPCADLVKLGKDSTVLIHEATLEDELFKEAAIKTHSTVSQAIKQGKAMNAKYTILTHFSQRYAKLPRLQYANKEGKILDRFKNVIVAFDNMQLRIEDLDHFHLLYPGIWALFAEEADNLEQTAKKRKQKMERKRRLFMDDDEEILLYKHMNKSLI